MTGTTVGRQAQEAAAAGRDEARADVQPELPRHLAERLQYDQAQFAKHLTPNQIEESLQTASIRHEQAVETKLMNAHNEVEHAREVAATHEPRREDDVPGRVLHNDGDKLIPDPRLEFSVQAKKASVSEKQRELQQLEERLRLAEEKEIEMKRKLGLIG